MNSIVSALPYLQIIFSVLLIAGVLLQRSEAALGSAFGEDTWSSVHHSRRGAERTLFIATIVLAVLYAASAFLAVLSK